MGKLQPAFNRENITVEDLKRLKETFDQHAVDKQLNQEAFLKAFAPILGQQMPEAQLRLWFMRIDASANDSIDWDEFASFLLFSGNDDLQEDDDGEEGEEEEEDDDDEDHVGEDEETKIERKRRRNSLLRRRRGKQASHHAAMAAAGTNHNAEVLFIKDPRVVSVPPTEASGTKISGYNHSDHVGKILCHGIQQKYFTSSQDGTVRVWDMNTLEFESVMHNSKAWVTDMVFAKPQDSRLVVSSVDRVIAVYDTHSHRALRWFVGNTAQKTKVSVSWDRPCTRLDIDMRKLSVTSRLTDSSDSLQLYRQRQERIRASQNFVSSIECNVLNKMDFPAMSMVVMSPLALQAHREEQLQAQQKSNNRRSVATALASFADNGTGGGGGGNTRHSMVSDPLATGNSSSSNGLNIGAVEGSSYTTSMSLAPKLINPQASGSTGGLGGLVSMSGITDDRFFFGLSNGTIQSYDIFRNPLPDVVPCDFNVAVHEGFVTGIKWIPSAGGLFSCGSDGHLCFLHVDRPGVFASLTGPYSTHPIHSFDWVEASRLFATCGTERHINLWAANVSARDGPPMQLKGHLNSVSQVLCVPDEDYLLVSLDVDKCVKVWDVRTLRCIQSSVDYDIYRPSNKLSAMSYDPSKQCLVFASTAPVVWPMSKLLVPYPDPKYKGHQRPVVAVLYNEEFKQIVSVDGEKVIFWSAETGDICLKLTVETLRSSAVRSSIPNESYGAFVAASLDFSKRRLVLAMTSSIVVVANFANGQMLREMIPVLDRHGIVTQMNSVLQHTSPDARSGGNNPGNSSGGGGGSGRASPTDPNGAADGTSSGSANVTVRNFLNATETSAMAYVTAGAKNYVVCLRGYELLIWEDAAEGASLEKRMDRIVNLLMLDKQILIQLSPLPPSILLANFYRGRNTAGAFGGGGGTAGHHHHHHQAGHGAPPSVSGSPGAKPPASDKDLLPTNSAPGDGSNANAGISPPRAAVWRSPTPLCMCSLPPAHVAVGTDAGFILILSSISFEPLVALGDHDSSININAMVYSQGLESLFVARSDGKVAVYSLSLKDKRYIIDIRDLGLPVMVSKHAEGTVHEKDMLDLQQQLTNAGGATSTSSTGYGSIRSGTTTGGGKNGKHASQERNILNVRRQPNLVALDIYQGPPLDWWDAVDAASASTSNAATIDALTATQSAVTVVNGQSQAWVPSTDEKESIEEMKKLLPPHGGYISATGIQKDKPCSTSASSAAASPSSSSPSSPVSASGPTAKFGPPKRHYGMTLVVGDDEGYYYLWDISSFSFHNHSIYIGPTGGAGANAAPASLGTTSPQKGNRSTTSNAASGNYSPQARSRPTAAPAPVAATTVLPPPVGYTSMYRPSLEMPFLGGRKAHNDDIAKVVLFSFYPVWKKSANGGSGGGGGGEPRGKQPAAAKAAPAAGGVSPGTSGLEGGATPREGRLPMVTTADLPKKKYELRVMIDRPMVMTCSTDCQVRLFQAFDDPVSAGPAPAAGATGAVSFPPSSPTGMNSPSDLDLSAEGGALLGGIRPPKIPHLEGAGALVGFCGHHQNPGAAQAAAKGIGVVGGAGTTMGATWKLLRSEDTTRQVVPFTKLTAPVISIMAGGGALTNADDKGGRGKRRRQTAASNDGISPAVPTSLDDPPAGGVAGMPAPAPLTLTAPVVDIASASAGRSTGRNPVVTINTPTSVPPHQTVAPATPLVAVATPTAAGSTSPGTLQATAAPAPEDPFAKSLAATANPMGKKGAGNAGAVTTTKGSSKLPPLALHSIPYAPVTVQAVDYYAIAKAVSGAMSWLLPLFSAPQHGHGGGGGGGGGGHPGKLMSVMSPGAKRQGGPEFVGASSINIADPYGQNAPSAPPMRVQSMINAPALRASNNNNSEQHDSSESPGPSLHTSQQHTEDNNGTIVVPPPGLHSRSHQHHHGSGASPTSTNVFTNMMTTINGVKPSQPPPLNLKPFFFSTSDGTFLLKTALVASSGAVDASIAAAPTPSALLPIEPGMVQIATEDGRTIKLQSEADRHLQGGGGLSTLVAVQPKVRVVKRTNQRRIDTVSNESSPMASPQASSSRGPNPRRYNHGAQGPIVPEASLSLMMGSVSALERPTAGAGSSIMLIAPGEGSSNTSNAAAASSPLMMASENTFAGSLTAGPGSLNLVPRLNVPTLTDIPYASTTVSSGPLSAYSARPPGSAGGEGPLTKIQRRHLKKQHLQGKGIGSKASLTQMSSASDAEDDEGGRAVESPLEDEVLAYLPEEKRKTLIQEFTHRQAGGGRGKRRMDVMDDVAPLTARLEEWKTARAKAATQSISARPSAYHSLSASAPPGDGRGGEASSGPTEAGGGYWTERPHAQLNLPNLDTQFRAEVTTGKRMLRKYAAATGTTSNNGAPTAFPPIAGAGHHKHVGPTEDDILADIRLRRRR